MSADLVAFLLARLAEDEALAQYAERFHPSPWRLDPEVESTMPSGRWVADADDEGVAVANGDSPAKMLARHDPARVLADVEAKREIIELHGDQHDCVGERPGYEWPYTGCSTLRLLAQVYAEHPDYREEWKP